MDSIVALAWLSASISVEIHSFISLFFFPSFHNMTTTTFTGCIVTPALTTWASQFTRNIQTFAIFSFIMLSIISHKYDILILYFFPTFCFFVVTSTLFTTRVAGSLLQTNILMNNSATFFKLFFCSCYNHLIQVPEFNSRSPLDNNYL
jgi:hypothetical protein